MEKKMNVAPKEQSAEVNKEEKKLTYEQLNGIANQLFQENNKLKAMVNKLSDQSAFAKLDFLFKVVDSAYAFPADFRAACAKEIQDAMTTPIEESKETPKEETKED